MKALKKLRDYLQIILIVVLVVTIMLVFTTADIDNEPPTISGIGVMNETANSAIVYWNTNEAATSKIDYGTSQGNYMFTFESSDFVTQHALLLQDLESNTRYYFVVSSIDINGYENVSEENDFTTLQDQTPPQWSNPTAIPELPVPYDSSGTYEFKVTWTDSSGIDQVSINFNGEEAETVRNNSEYQYFISSLAAGDYEWLMIANDSYDNEGVTDNFTYSIQKAEPTINLFLNSLEENITVIENSTVNISGILYKGEKVLELFIDGIDVTPNGPISSNQIQFTKQGIHIVMLRINESENYTAKEIVRQVEVTPLELSVIPNKETYSLGETAGLSLSFPEGATINLEVCGPMPVGGSGFVECNSLPSVSGVSSPYAVVHQYTSKVGEYLINADTTFNEALLEDFAPYSVSNSIVIDVSGDKSVLTGDDIELTASATGGMAPYTYTWKRADGTTHNGDTLEIKYNGKGTYSTNISVQDTEGNKISQIFNINVRQKYIATIVVRDKETQSKILDAIVEIDNEEKLTDSNGETRFELSKDDYEITINADDYKRLRQTIDIDKNESFIFDLVEDDGSTTIKNFDIILESPSDDADITESSVTFKARIETNKNAECTLYLNEQGDDWSKQINEFTVTATMDVEHTESVEDNKEYSWRFECEVDGVDYQSGTRTFRTPGVKTFSNDNPEVVDAGELRRRLADGLDNLGSLDFQEKQVADALKLDRQLELALKTYDRTVRDINNIQYRTDLSESERDDKRLEYRDNLRELENTVPIDVSVIKMEEFIVYPKDEELRAIATEYSDEISVSGVLNLDAFTDLQNEISVKTSVSHISLELINGDAKEITLIDKIITFESEDQVAGFLLEHIPKEIAQTARDITFITEDEEIIKDDPLIKFSNSDRITYYVDGLKNFELAKSAYTVMFTESLYSRGGNKFTGAVTLGKVDFASPVTLIVLLVVVIIVYLLYAYDLHTVLFGFLLKKSKKKQIDRILRIIYDSKDQLEKGNLERANMIFKEVKLTYEKLRFDLKKETYPEAIELLKMINVKYFEELFAQTEKNHGENSVSKNQLTKLKFAYEEIEESSNNISSELRTAYQNLMSTYTK